jgi:Rps23 Pro-64 3,4-dihydroxylase Tpa1-like proline 4-hydroxylase
MFTDATFSATPFPHVRIPRILPDIDSEAALLWLMEKATWKLRVEDFYEQDEFSLLTTKLSEELKTLVEPSYVDSLRQGTREAFCLSREPILIDVNAHRLTPGQTIRIHNDFIGGEETHRILIQLNHGWKVENGGLLMLFKSAAPEDVSNVILPKHGSGFAFEISPRSFHAVSQIKTGDRYTVVYSFRAAT